MHHILEQLKQILHHVEAFEDSTLKRYGLKFDQHGRDLAADGFEYLYSLIDADGETFGCRVLLDDREASFEVFYEDNNETGDRAFSVVTRFIPATDLYELEVALKPRGLDEVKAVLGSDFEAKDDKLTIDCKQYERLIASMAKRYAETSALKKGN